MVRTVVAGIDGSSESLAAAEWAAREAKLRGLPLKLVHVWEPVPEPTAQVPSRGTETSQDRSDQGETGALPAEGWRRTARQVVEGVRLRQPGLDVTVQQLSGRPAEALTKVAEDAELLALGSRGLSGLGGFVMGSVGLSVVAHVQRPVVLVRAGKQAVDKHEPGEIGIPPAATRYRPVVLGIDVGDTDDAVLAFAFREAGRRATALRVVHGWNLPPYYVYGASADLELRDKIVQQQSAALAEILRPWQQGYPTVEVVGESRFGSPANHLVDASDHASLIVVGRRVRRSPIGAHIGPVTHAVLHHSTAPVAVVAHS
ncbi:universal stress protein [Streptomyces sp. NPDC048484]|uniref:universal stress protein n=1 Tax=Streptomyces sp. NPDC048484 TaxID=3155146 RepID=UPI0034246473